ncbi:hypothetical protein ACP4OV_020641 [Aristida adscensionis]
MAAGEQSPLRRWKRFFPAFDAIDAAIDAAGRPQGCSHAEHRKARGDLVEKLCDAAGDGDERRAEALCLLLDEAMAEALATLRLVRVTPAMLTATGLAGALRGLRRHHGAERVRALARDVAARWRATIEGDLARVRAALDRLSREERRAAAAVAGDDDVRGGARESTVVQAGRKQLSDGKIPEAPKKGSPPVVAGSAGGDSPRDGKTTGEEAAKRELPDGCVGEAEEDAKRRKVAELGEQRGHPVVRERRFSTSSHHKDGRLASR